MTLRILAVCLASGALAASAQDRGAADAFEKHVRPFLRKHCISCHGPEKQKSELRLDRLGPDLAARHRAEVWTEVLDKLNMGEMPPKKQPRPDRADVARVTAWITGELRRAEASAHGSGGRVVLRRLNRAEYTNTIRDLIGVPFQATDEFPQDAAAHGFDNIGSVLTVSPLHLEKYMRAARKIIDKAIVTGERPKPYLWHFEGSKKGWKKTKRGNVVVNGNDGIRNGRRVIRYTGGNNGINLTFYSRLEKGEYRIKVKAGSRVPPGHGYGPPRLKITQRGSILLETDVTAPEDKPDTFEVRFKPILPRLMIQIRNGYSIPHTRQNAPKVKKPDYPQPELVIEEYEIEGPMADEWPPASHKRILFPSMNSGNEPLYAREILERFMPRAFRRPVKPGEVEAMIGLFRKARKSAPSFEEAIKIPLIAVLTSPHFLYLVEGQSISDHALASRLSYFLWSTLPDPELLRLAASGKLRNGEVLDAQVDRLLKDPKSRAFVANFAGQWLRLRDVGRVVPDMEIYYRYDEHLEQSMVRESEAFFSEILHHDLSVMKFIDSDFAMLNERMARFYGIKGVKGDHFRRVALDRSARRGGVLSQASMLTITSDGVRSSPVRRGVWILENLLDDPPAPPPPNAGDLTPTAAGEKSATIRERLRKHREIETCAACHAKIDPLGFGLENYDGIGLWRDKEATGRWGRTRPNDPVIDATGRLPDGRSFNGPQELKALLLKEEDRFLGCLVEKLFTYALGRGVGFSDRKALAELQPALKSDGLRGLIKAIVRSRPFQTK